MPAERLINANYLPAPKLEMHNLLIERTVAERMFSRHSTVLMSLLKADSTDPNIIERHLNELHNRWNALGDISNYLFLKIPCHKDDTH